MRSNSCFELLEPAEAAVSHAQARQDNIKSGFKPSKNADQPINTGKGYQLDLVDRGDFWHGVNVPVRQD